MLKRLSLINRRISIYLPRFSSAENSQNQVNEKDLKSILAAKLPNAQEIEVQDVSGGCGAMFEVYVSSKEFKGLTTVKQHLLINNILKEEIKNMHGIRIQTAVPE